jgi:ABC-2 type transport system ATP-binding protein
MSEDIIQVDGLSKTYPTVAAVNNIAFNVTAGEIFAFLGPNGAGKTTTIAMLTTLLRPSAGRAWVAGHDIVRQQTAVRRAIGLVFQEPTLDPRLTAYENLDFHAVLYGVPRSQRPARIRTALELADLADRAHDFVERFSGGMKRRLEIARTLIHAPHVLFLDEPTLGLDPQTRRRLWEHIHYLRDERRVTIFLTTHYLDEADVADRIAIIDRGEIVALDTPAALKGQVGGDIITLRTPSPAADALLIEAQFETPVQLYAEEIRLEVANGETFIPRFFREFDGVVTSISLHRPTLDDVFLKLTGRSMRDSAVADKDLALEELRAVTPL